MTPLRVKTPQLAGEKEIKGGGAPRKMRWWKQRIRSGRFIADAFSAYERSLASLGMTV
jgi:hypothetical protein